MTLNCYKFEFSRNFALLHNEWRWTSIVSDRILAHWKYFSTMDRWRWYCLDPKWGAI